LKILILKPSSLGDVVQALPVLRLLKLHLPGSKIFWWVDSNLAPLLEADPDLAGVIRFERRGWAAPPNWVNLCRQIQWTREQSFDWVIDLQCLARSGAFAWLANGKFLIGLDEPREGARGFYDVVVPRRSFQTHAVDWYLDVLQALNVPAHWNFKWLPERPQVLAGLKEKWRTNPSRWIVLQPGARWPNKRWPIEYYAELTRQMASALPDFRFVILGGEADRELGAVIAQAEAQRVLDLTGRVSLPEMVEWIRLSELVISNDTGPMHVAAALGKPVLAVFGPTDPRRTGPYGQLEHVVQTQLPCVPCMKSYCTNPRPLECLRAISPDLICAAAMQILNSSKGK
jgi:lipopolysaccharide heptosyltransferase I